MTTQKIIENVIKDYGSPYGEAEITPDDRLIGAIADPFAEEPFEVVILIDDEQQCLIVTVPEITNDNISSFMRRRLLRINNNLLLGALGIDEDGCVGFHVTVPIDTDTEGVWEADTNMIERLLKVTASTVLSVRAATVFVSMVESGIDESSAQEFVDKHMSKFI